MLYTAKALPRWVRFRPKPKPRPMFGPPTALQHTMTQLFHRAVDRFLDRSAHMPKLLDVITEGSTRTLRVRLPDNYAKE